MGVNQEDTPSMSTYEERQHNSKLYLEQAKTLESAHAQRVLTLAAKLERARDMAKVLYHNAESAGKVNPLLADLVKLLAGGEA